MIVKKVKTMAIRKNKKRFDPRYFMDERTETPLNEEKGERPSLRIPASNPAADKWHREQAEAAREEEERKKRDAGPIDDNAGRYGQIPEGLENVTPENLAIVAQAAAIVAGNFAPAVILGALGLKLKDAIDYLRANSEPATPPEEDLEENSAGWAGAAVDQLRGSARPQGSADEAAKRLYSLVGDQKMHDALQTIKDNFPSLGDVKKLEPMTDSEFADDKLRNAIKILTVLGKRIEEWCPDCEMQRKSSKMPEDPTDIPEPGQLQEKRRRLKKKRFK